MSTSVVSGVDAAPILEACEQVLDLVALAVEDRIVGVLDAVAGMGRDAGCDAALEECLSKATELKARSASMELAGGRCSITAAAVL